MRIKRLALAVSAACLLGSDQARAQDSDDSGGIRKCGVRIETATKRLYPDEKDRKLVEGKIKEEKFESAWTIFTLDLGEWKSPVALCLMDTLLLRVSSQITHIEPAEGYLRIEIGPGKSGYASAHMLHIGYLSQELKPAATEKAVPQMHALPGIHYHSHDKALSVSIIGLRSPAPTLIHEWLDLGQTEVEAVTERKDVWYGDRESPRRKELLAIVDRAAAKASGWSLQIQRTESLAALKSDALSRDPLKQDSLSLIGRLTRVLMGELAVDGVPRPLYLLFSSSGDPTLFWDSPQSPKPSRESEKRGPTADKPQTPKPAPEKKPDPLARPR